VVKRRKIIYYPGNLSPYRHWLERAVKFGLSFLTFFATLILWGYYGGYLYGRLFYEEYFERTLNVMGQLLLAALAAFVVMLAWQEYNLRVFGSKKRRIGGNAVPDDQISRIYAIDAEHIAPLRQAKMVYLTETAQAATWRFNEDETVVSGVFHWRADG
jgi:poly-beta-1,6-N-acetyl-D-glucosamine biosynthesis protein PgaD